MFRSNFEPISENLLKEAQIAERLASPLTRLAGVCMMLALAVWSHNATSAIYQLRMLVGMETIGKVLALSQAPLGSTGSDEQQIDTVEDARAVLQEREQAANRRLQELFERIRGEKIVQGALAVSWIIITTLVGANMLGAALMGFMGSQRARKWFRLVIYWSLFATATTIGGMVALSVWGGFPAIESPAVLMRELFVTREPLIVTRMIRVQTCFAILTLIALLFTHKSAHAAR